MCAKDKDDNDDQPWNEPVRKQTERQLEALRSFTEFRMALEALTKAGCEPLHVVWLLGAVVGWNRWNEISRESMTACAKDLKSAEEAIRTLFFSQAAAVIGLTSLELAHALASVADSVERLAPESHLRRRMAANMAKAALVRYVLDATKDFQDDHVSAVISVALNAENIQEHAYTRDAHIRWRSRPPYKQFLREPAKERVLELLKAMEADLAAKS